MRVVVLVLALWGCKGGEAPPTSEPAAAGEALRAPIASVAPAVTEVLSGPHTQAFVAIEDLAGFSVELERMLAAFPPAFLVGAPPFIADASARRAAIGFDPTRAEGWAEVGLDARAGLALAFDDRLPNRPYLLARITDPVKLRAALTQRGVVVEAPSALGLLQRTAVNGHPVLLAQRGAWALILPDAEPEKDAAAFGALAVADAPLRDLPELRDAFSDGIAPLWLSAWTAPARWPNPAQKLAGGAELAWYAERFPAAAYALGRGDGVLRILANPAARASLAKLFTPRSQPPAFSKNLSEVMAIRFDLNFAQLFDGLAELIPPDVAELRSNLSMARGLLPMALGVSLEELDAALTGHGMVMLAAPNSGRPPASAALALGVTDGPKTDALLSRALSVLANRMGEPTTEAKVGGHPAQVLTMAPYTFVALRVENMVWIGEKGVVEAALAAAPLPAGIAAQVDRSMAVGLLMHLSAMPPSVSPGDDARMVFEVSQRLWSPYLTDGWMITNIRLDDRGLRVGEGPGGASMLGIAAAIGVPAFIGYRAAAIAAPMSAP